MELRFISKKLEARKEEAKKLYEKNAQVFMNREFEKLLDKHLSLPIILGDL